MSQYQPPEEKLLHLIRNSPQAAAPSVGPAARSGKQAAKKRDTAARLAWLSVAAACLLLILSLAESPSAGRIVSVHEDKEPGFLPTVRYAQKVFPLEPYLAAVNTGSFFSAPLASESAAFSSGVEDIVLVGIIQEDPVQAIIQERSSGSVHYVKAGDTVAELKVVRIEEGKIVVEYRDELYEIHL